MNKTGFLAFFWIFAFFLAQNALHLMFSVDLVPLVLVAVVYYALLEGASFGCLAGLFAGALFELFGTGRIGPQIAILGFLGAGSGIIASKIFRDSLPTQLLLPPLGGYFVALANLSLAGEGPRGWALLAGAFSWTQLLLTAAVSPFLFRFLKRVSVVRAERSSIRRAG